MLQHNYLLVFFFGFLLVEETTKVRTHSIEEKESKTSAMLENRDAKLHDCIRSAAQQHNDAASQPANGSKSEVREGNNEGHSGGRFRIGKCHSSGKFQPRNMKLKNQGNDIPPRGDIIF